MTHMQHKYEFSTNINMNFLHVDFLNKKIEKNSIIVNQNRVKKKNS